MPDWALTCLCLHRQFTGLCQWQRRISNWQWRSRVLPNWIWLIKWPKLIISWCLHKTVMKCFKAVISWQKIISMSWTPSINKVQSANLIRSAQKYRCAASSRMSFLPPMPWRWRNSSWKCWWELQLTWILRLTIIWQTTNQCCLPISWRKKIWVWRTIQRWSSSSWIWNCLKRTWSRWKRTSCLLCRWASLINISLCITRTSISLIIHGATVHRWCSIWAFLCIGRVTLRR